nr:MAG TPA: Sporozoite surface protein 2, gliding motility, VWA domain [Caudoviricetes sp.]
MIFLIYREKRKSCPHGHHPHSSPPTSVPAPCRELGI